VLEVAAIFWADNGVLMEGLAGTPICPYVKAG